MTESLSRSQTLRGCRPGMALRFGVAIAVTVLCLAGLAALGDAKGWITQLAGLSGGALALSVGLCALISACRAVRVAALLQTGLTISLFRISVTHNFLAALAPARTGEAALPVLLRGLANASWVHGLSVLITARIYDLLCILALAAAGIAGTAEAILPPYATTLAITAAAVAVISAMAMLALPQTVAMSLALLSRHSPSKRGGLVGRLANIVREAGDTFSALGNRVAVRLTVATLLIWLIQGALFHLFARELELDLTLPVIALALAANALAFVLPINGIASIGPAQAATAGVFAALGYDWQLGFVISLAVNGVMLITTGILTSATWLIAARRPQPTAPSSGAERDE